MAISPFVFFKMAFKSLRRHPVRSVLALIGIIIGIASMIVTMALGEGAKARLRREILSMGENWIYVVPGNFLAQGEVKRNKKKEGSLSYEDYQVIRDVSEAIQAATPSLKKKEKVHVQGNEMVAEVQGVNADLLVGFLGLPFTFLFLIILVPIASVVGLYLSAAINHIFVNIFIKDHQPFEETLKVVAYCMGVNILMVVPVFGGLAAGILQVVFLIIGLREIHHTNTSQAVLAVILPYLLCCGFFVTIISLIMSFIFSGFIAL